MKSDQEEIEKLKHAVWGLQGDNGLYGTVKELKKEISLFKKKVLQVKTIFGVMVFFVMLENFMLEKSEVLKWLIKFFTF